MRRTRTTIPATALVMAVTTASTSMAQLGFVTTDLRLEGPGEDSLFGSAILRVEGFDGSGRARFAVGAPSAESQPLVRPGQVLVFDESGALLYTYTGTADGESFGAAIAAGDVNGDGFTDLLIGSPSADVNGTNSGRVSVLPGGPIPSATPILVIDGLIDFSGVGNSIASTDLDADGIEDLVIGRPGLASGNVDVYLGTTGVFSGTADVVLGDGAFQEQFGASIDVLDINRDGIEDLLVGSPSNAGGQAFIYRGGLGFDGTILDVIAAPAGAARFGQRVANLGDVTNDGADDFGIGAPFDDTVANDAGSARIYAGGFFYNGVPITSLFGERPLSRFGTEIAAVGDVDGNGYNDFAIAAPFYATPALDVGRVTVYSPTGSGWPISALVTGASPGALAGTAIAGAGDIDDDGLAEMIIGSPGVAVATRQPHARGVLTLGALDVQSRDFASWVNDGSGAVWDAGEVTKVSFYTSEPSEVAFYRPDGYREVLVNNVPPSEDLKELLFRLPLAEDTGQGRLEIRKIFMSTGGPGAAVQGENFDVRGSRDAADPIGGFTSAVFDPQPSWVEIAGLAGDELGFSAAPTGMGIVDNGVDAYATGAPGSNGETGSVVFRDGQSSTTIDGEQAGDRFGQSLTSGFDVTGNGAWDVLVGAPGANAIYLVEGVPDGLPTATTRRIDAPVGAQGFGENLKWVDYNGDGSPDAIVSAPFGDGSIHALDGIDDYNSVLFSVLGGPGDELGTDFAVGDVTGDGQPNLVVSSPGRDANGVDSGALDFIAGGPDGPYESFYDFPGPGPNARAGESVTTSVLLGGNRAAFGFTVEDQGTSAVELHMLWRDEVQGVWVTSDVGTIQPDGQSVSRPIETLGFEWDLVERGASASFESVIMACIPGNNVLFLNGDAAPLLGGAAVLTDGAPDAARREASPFLEIPMPDGDGEITSITSLGDVDGDNRPELGIGFGTRSVGAARGTGPEGVFYVVDVQGIYLDTSLAGTTWPVGSTQTIPYRAVGPVDVLLSTDGGANYDVALAHVDDPSARSVSFTVPHVPTRYARVKMRLSDRTIDVPFTTVESDSFFTVEPSIELLAFRTEQEPDGGMWLRWSTRPGPEDLAGYTIDARSGADGWRRLADGLGVAELRVPHPRPGDAYRLTAVNGLGEAYVLGELSTPPAPRLAASPVPFRAGELHVRFTSGWEAGESDDAHTTVAVYDVSGRRVVTLVDGALGAGVHEVRWDGRDRTGHALPSGMYFLRARTGGRLTTLKIPMLR